MRALRETQSLQELAWSMGLRDPPWYWKIYLLAPVKYLLQKDWGWYNNEMFSSLKHIMDSGKKASVTGLPNDSQWCWHSLVHGSLRITELKGKTIWAGSKSNVPGGTSAFIPQWFGSFPAYSSSNNSLDLYHQIIKRPAPRVVDVCYLPGALLAFSCTNSL